MASGLQALTLILLMRSLGAVQFGQFAAVAAAAGIVVVILGLGLNSLALRVSAFEDSREVATTIAILRLPVAFVGATITSCVAFLVVGSGSLPILLIAALYSASESIGEGVEALLYGCSREGRAQLTLLIRRTILLAGVSAGFVFDNGQLIFAASIALVVLFLAFPLMGTLSRPASVRRTVRLAAPLWLATVLAKLQTLDVVVASFALSPATAGVYAAATRVTSPLNTFAVATLSILTPRLASNGSSAAANRLFSDSRRAMGFAALALVIVSPAVGWLTNVALGPNYGGVFWVATILACMTAVAALTQVYVSLFYASGRGLTVAKIRFIVVPVALVIGGLLAYVFGPVALALTMLGSQLALWLALAVFYNRHVEGDWEAPI